MNGPWIRELVRKILPGRQLQAASRHGRRRGVCLRCEPLEDRVLMYAPNFEAISLLPAPPTGTPAIVSTATVNNGPSDVSAIYDVIRNISFNNFNGPGLEQLLQDIRELPAPAPPVPSSSPSFNYAPESAQPPNAPANLKVLGGASRAEAEPARPGADVRTTPPRGETDLPARPVPQPESPGTTPGGPAASPPARGDSAPATSAYQPRPYDGTGANGVQPNPGPGGGVATEIVPQARAAATTAMAVGAVAVARTAAEVSDGLLLQRFVAGHEQEAFTALVRRHERFVLGVCERVLGDPHAARDAVQLTFLALARKAGVLDRHGPLAGWLWTVASRHALRLRATTARRKRKEKQAADDRPPLAHRESDPPEALEMREALREELQRLPEKHRGPLVLCYFDGRTHEEAARALGIPRGSIAKRIAEALERLRERLRSRGFTP
jgi:RNA polymerase sigma factor (sigma-70 family)